MSYGISVVNDSGVIVIDQDYSNYTQYSSGSIGNGGGIVIPNINGALVFVRGGGTVYVVSGGIPNTTMILKGTFSVVYFIVVVPASSITSLGGYGLDIKRSDGTLAYSSTLVVPTLAGMGFVDSQTSGTTISIASSPKSRYFCINPCCAVGNNVNYDGMFWRLYWRYLVGSYVSENIFTFSPYNSPTAYQQFPGNGSETITPVTITGTRSILIMEI